MLNTQTFHALLELEMPQDRQTALIYAKQNSPRLEYACRFIFNHVLKLNYKVTNDTLEFASSKEIRINYSDTNIDGAFQILPQGLIFERGVDGKKPESYFEEGMIYFNRTASGNFPYDLFSSVFYFISRYEEWQPFAPDKHQRFEVTSSILFEGKFHLKPVVDIWIQELKNALEKFYPEIKLPGGKFKVISTIDVDNLYAYKSKSFLRTAGASVKDLLKSDLKNLSERIKVLAGRKKDPFDIYEEVSDFCFGNKIPLIYFFLFRTGNAHDRTVDPRSPSFKKVFKTLKENHALLGLHPSYNSSVHKELLTQEIKAFTERSDETITLSRQHYLRFNIRTTPGLLIENGIRMDFTMGYASAPGFRAGTSHPFYYYDFNKEESRDLLFVPFCVMDGAYTVYENALPDKALEEMISLAKEIKKVNGIFISVFHERTFSEHLFKGFGVMYKKFHSFLIDLR